MTKIEFYKLVQKDEELAERAKKNLLEVLQEYNVELSEEDIENIAGGLCIWNGKKYRIDILCY